MEFKGQVQKIIEKNGTGKTGKPYTMYSLILGTTQGEVMIGTGFDKPACPPGSIVSIDATQNGQYWNGNPSTLKILKEEGSPPADNKQIASGVGQVDQRQRSIVTQNAYSTAANVINSALEHGVLVLPKGKSATNHSLDAYLEVLGITAQHIFDITISGLVPSPEDDSNSDNSNEEGDYDPLS